MRKTSARGGIPLPLPGLACNGPVPARPCRYPPPSGPRKGPFFFAPPQPHDGPDGVETLTRTPFHAKRMTDFCLLLQADMMFL